MTSLIVTGGRVHPRPGQAEHAELAVQGRVIAPSANRDRGALRIRADGASVVPLLVDTVFADPQPPVPDAFDLVPGNPATFAVAKGHVDSSRITGVLVINPADLIAVVIDGEVVARTGNPSHPRDRTRAGDPRLGAWSDISRRMTQHLTPDGRYSETRHGRPNAFTGRFWLTGNRITYLDDSGFWAFGQFHRGVLHHAGFVLRPGALDSESDPRWPRGHS